MDSQLWLSKHTAEGRDLTLTLIVGHYICRARTGAPMVGSMHQVQAQGPLAMLKQLQQELQEMRRSATDQCRQPLWPTLTCLLTYFPMSQMKFATPTYAFPGMTLLKCARLQGLHLFIRSGANAKYNFILPKGTSMWPSIVLVYF